MFKKGDKVVLKRGNKKYRVLVTGVGNGPEEFAGVIYKSDFTFEFSGQLAVGSYDTDYYVHMFELVKGKKNK